MKQLQNFRNFLQGVYEEQITDDDDLVLLMIGDEGAGKSTLMLWATIFWLQFQGRQSTPENCLDRIVYGDREEYKQKLLNSDETDIVTVQDAPHVLFSKEAMHGEQIDIEKAMVDIRINNYLMVMGFQSWDMVPKDFRSRRAQAGVRVYKNDDGDRGFMDIYGREELNTKYSELDEGEWPDPAYKDQFPSLEGTDIWERFNEADEKRKEERLEDSKEPAKEDIQKEEQIKIALRAVKPWTDERGMTQKDAATLTDYSQAWVSDKVQNWRKGAYRDLVDENDDANRVTRKGSA